MRPMPPSEPLPRLQPHEVLLILPDQQPGTLEGDRELAHGRKCDRRQAGIEIVVDHHHGHELAIHPTRSLGASKSRNWAVSIIATPGGSSIVELRAWCLTFPRRRGSPRKRTWAASRPVRLGGQPGESTRAIGDVHRRGLAGKHRCEAREYELHEQFAVIGRRHRQAERSGALPPETRKRHVRAIDQERP